MILNKEKYLYLLPLKKLPFFKVGISSGDFSRINHLNRLYELDLDKALIVKSSNQRLIAVIEREILSVFEHKISDFKKTNFVKNMLIMKTGDKAIADPKLTGLDTWVKGEVIDVEINPFKGVVIAIKDKLGRIFFGEEKYFKLA